MLGENALRSFYSTQRVLKKQVSVHGRTPQYTEPWGEKKEKGRKKRKEKRKEKKRKKKNERKNLMSK